LISPKFDESLWTVACTSNDFIICTTQVFGWGDTC
jgi:hypothetical protein